MSTRRRVLLALSLLAVAHAASAQDGVALTPPLPGELRFTSLAAVPLGVYATAARPVRRFALVREGDHLRLDALRDDGSALHGAEVTLTADGRLALAGHLGLALRREGAALRLSIGYCYERVTAFRAFRAGDLQ